MLPPRVSIAGRVGVLAVLYGCLVVMLRAAEGGALSLFLGYLGAEKLPYTFLAISLVDVPMTLLYLQVAERVPTRRLLGGLAVLLALILGGAVLLGGLHRGAGLFVAYMAATIFTTFISIQWGAAILEFFTVRESMRAFPLIYLGAHGGGLVAGLLLRHLALPLGTENVVVLVPAAACVAVLILIVAAGKLREGRAWRQDGEVEQQQRSRKAPPSIFEGARKLRLLRASPLLRAVAAATAVMVCLRLALRYVYGAGFEAAFPDPDDLARFIGTYTVLASGASIAMQVLVTPALLRWLGVGLLNALYSYLVGGALLASAIWPGLPAAVAGRATDQDLKSALKTPLSPMFYEALGERGRKDGRALILGIVSPVASLIASLLLVAVTGARLPPAWIAGAGAALAVVYVVLSHAQGRAYHRSLEELLLGWHRERSGDEEATLDEALARAVRSEDRRINDMAREVRRRRRELRRKGYSRISST